MFLHIFQSILPLFLSLIPLYITMGLGYICGKTLKIDYTSIANLLFYILSPIVTFSGIINLEIDKTLMMLPLIVFLISCLMCIIVQKLAAVFGLKNLRNIIAFSSGSSNTGNFGLPLALVILNEETVGIYILAFIGVVFFENTYGFYIAAKGMHTAITCLKKMLKLPSFYGATFAIILSHFETSQAYALCKEFFFNSRSTYIMLGMLALGMQMSKMAKSSFDWKCISFTFFTRYCIMPSIMFLVVYLDRNIFNLYSEIEHKAMLILSILPMSVSTMIVASVLKYPEDKISAVVILSTIISLLYVPLMVTLFGLYTS